MAEEMQSSLPVAKKYFGETAQIYDAARQIKEETHQDQFVIENALRAFVGRGSQVLDIACGEGFFAEELARNGNHVVGVDALAAPKNAAVMDQYIRMDLTQPAGLSAAVEGQHFDHVLLLDILEHLPQPERLLAEARAAAGPKGQIVVSVPNVANLTVRLALLFGRFEYADRGIMDRTHLRFFTHSSARRLLERNGLEIIASRTTVVPLELVVGLSRICNLTMIVPARQYAESGLKEIFTVGVFHFDGSGVPCFWAAAVAPASIAAHRSSAQSVT